MEALMALSGLCQDLITLFDVPVALAQHRWQRGACNPSVGTDNMSGVPNQAQAFSFSAPLL